LLKAAPGALLRDRAFALRNLLRYIARVH